MQGPEGAAAYVAEWLKSRLPQRLRIIEARVGTVRLPDPAAVIDYETGPLSIENWPIVYVLPQGLKVTRPAELRDDASELYRSTYDVQIIALVRGDGYRATDLLRKRYALAIREALLERKTLTPADAEDPATYTGTVLPETIREDYGEVVTDTAKRTIAGVEVRLDIVVEELLAPYAAPVGTLITLDVAPEALTPHPAYE